MLQAVKRTDAQLMQAICNGAHPAFAELVQRHHQACYRIAWRSVFSKADAEDIVQHCLLKIWQRPHLWNPKKGVAFTTWLYRIVVNACIDFNRKHQRIDLETELGHSLDQQLHQQADQQQIQHDAVEEHTSLHQALLHLKPIQQQVINLFYYEELSTAQTAEILQTTTKAVEGHLARARKHLAILLEASDD